MKTTGWCLVMVWICVVGAASGWAQAPEPAEVKLPVPSFKGTVSVEAAMFAKKSTRSYSATPLTLAEVSQLLWAANGSLPVDAVSGATVKVIPSAGGIYPLEVFLVSGKDAVTDLPAGVHQYVPQTCSLKTIATGDMRNQLAYACLGQTWMARAPVMVVVGGVFQRTTAKYGQRGYAYVYMEAGSANQNLYLQAEAMGLRLGSVGAFNDDQVSTVCRLPAGVTPLLVVPAGK